MINKKESTQKKKTRVGIWGRVRGFHLTGQQGPASQPHARPAPHGCPFLVPVLPLQGSLNPKGHHHSSSLHQPGSCKPHGGESQTDPEPPGPGLSTAGDPLPEKCPHSDDHRQCQSGPIWASAKSTQVSSEKWMIPRVGGKQSTKWPGTSCRVSWKEVLRG